MGKEGDFDACGVTSHSVSIPYMGKEAIIQMMEWTNEMLQEKACQSPIWVRTTFCCLFHYSYKLWRCQQLFLGLLPENY